MKKPTVYRGVTLDDQAADRVRKVVKPAIDRTLKAKGHDALLAIAGDITEPLFAADRLQEIFEQHVADRLARPPFDLRDIAARLCGLRDPAMRSATHYCSKFDPVPAPGAKGPARR